MNCLVTGGAGFIGSHVADRLLYEGHKVTVLDNLSTGTFGNVPDGANFHLADITDKDLWRRLPKYDAVFHLAALARIQPSIKDPVTSHEHNVNGTLNVLEYCRHNKAKLIFSSSSSIYEGSELPSRELSPKEAKNPYSLHKLINEQYIQLYRDLFGLDAVVLRYFNVYGERQLLTGSYATVVGIFLKQKADGKSLTITGDGEQRRDFTYVGDVARANLLALDWSGDFNIGAGHNYSVNQVAEMVGGDTRYIDPRPGEVRETLADNTKARANDWTPTPNALEDYIGKATKL